MISKRFIFVAVIAFRGMLLSMDKEQRFYFKKEEKLTGDKRIESLFAQGKSFVAYPLRVVYLAKTSQNSVTQEILVSIPKKRIKSAVKRNRMKRLIRESFRFNKHILNDVLEVKFIHLEIAFVYVKDELTDFATVEKGMRKALSEIKNRLENGRE
ncbi:MAG: ribonuclease P protein component [Fermentimonas sp.]|nr:ribonuclease P protein component [Fermentimonas sp.]